MGYYLTKAKPHLEKIKYYYDHGGPYGYSQANHHYHTLGDCYQNSGTKQRHMADAPVLQQMYSEATKLMNVMKRREDGLPDEEGE